MGPEVHDMQQLYSLLQEAKAWLVSDLVQECLGQSARVCSLAFSSFFQSCSTRIAWDMVNGMNARMTRMFNMPSH